MTTADPVRAAPVSVTPASLRLVVTAERLFALHGIDGVSLRQISTEAGSANNSAVHYHFGSRQGLVAAIFQHRLPQIISERRLLASRCDPEDLRSRLEAHLLPVLHIAEATDNHYVSFVEQLQRWQLGSGQIADLSHLTVEGVRSNEDLRQDLRRLLDHLEEPLRMLRIAEVQALSLHAAADRERAVSSGVELAPFELFASSLLDGLAAYLEAPASDSTRRWLRGADGGSAHISRPV